VDKSVSIVVVREAKNYRKLAQKSWGLTDEQMKGMHVHHCPPVCEGGRNISEHLYVCSPSMHAFGWHSEQYWISTQQLAAEMGRQTQKEMGLWVWSKDWQSKNGTPSWDDKYGVDRAFEMRSAAGSVGVLGCHSTCEEQGKGAWDPEVRKKARAACKEKKRSFYSKSAQRLNSLKRWGYSVSGVRMKPDTDLRTHLSETFIDYYCHYGKPK